ncbi:uncharacterized protein LOC124695262 [Lolium rigidum]|uniref:uncharacterized protein LOC124695262 n=1 Tax=Lolium rigidum TaxID=89674 RepID=UPI001F5DA3D4|nr:uncharacterized protein LOC124695262 [Lolium rigidum]
MDEHGVPFPHLERGTNQGPSSAKKLQLKAYAKTDAELPESQRQTGKDCIPVMVSITAPSGMEAQREPVDLVVVLHVRKGRNVPEKWQELLKVALEIVTGKLDTKDCLAVVPFMPSLLPMSEKNAKAVFEKYKPESIQTDTSLVIDLESAESIFNGRTYEDKKKRAGYIVVISNSEDDINSLLTSRFLSVHAFGFRGAHNAWTIHTIASSRDCSYAILDDELGRITQAFAATIDRITSAVAVMPIEIQLRCEEKVHLSGLIGSPRISYSISDNKKNGTIWPRAHLPDVPTNFVFLLYTGNLRNDECIDLSKVLKVSAKYYQNPRASQARTTTNFPKGQNGIGEVLGEEVEVVTVSKDMPGSKEVAAEIVRLEAVRIIHEIIEENTPDWDQLRAAAVKQRDRWTKLEKYNEGDDEDGKKNLEIKEVLGEIILENKTDWEKLRGAADKLRKGWITLKNSRCGLAAGELISSLSLEMQEMETRLYNNYMWPEYLLSWKSHQWWQLPLPPLFMDKLDTEDDPLLRLRITANVDDIPRHKKGLPVLVQVMAPEVGLAKAKRAPVDVVALLDTEKKTKKKRELLIKAMEVIMDKLGHQDRIAIIPVQTGTTQPAARFMDMSKQGRRETSIKLKSIVVKKPAPAAPYTVPSATQTSHGRDHSKFIKFITNCLGIAPTNPPALIPSPVPSGSDVVTDDGTKLWEALKDAEKLLDAHRKKDHIGFIIVISDSNGDFVRQETLTSKYTMHAFGFRECGPHNIRAMHYIANSSSDGIYAIIDDHLNQVTCAFKACINKITSTLTVLQKLKEAAIFVGALYAGAVRNFIVYVDKVDMVSEEDYANFSKLFTIDVKWLNAFTSKDAPANSGALPSVNDSAEHKEKLDGKVFIVRDGSNESKEVMTDIIVRFKAVKIIHEVTNPNYKKEVLIERLQNICHGNTRLVRDIQTMVANLRRDIDILSHMLSWETFQGLSEYPPMK